ncbi:class I SAM-dependent methyltransferase [Actinophytocola oryzae]|uniref:Methyltransferase family protein n=1 Tax=Actinophytocola oryzae TaxID=502181 RepID=A0A4R7VMQ3_9PSEU|nr:class I SAM-dependent methyltransferase [Actinophytocola oryzae]TDV50896.1 methyltransferase family protein [Actinophytocola oryzae]
MSGIRGAYVTGVRTVRKAVDKTGLLSKLESSESPKARHVRTLFSIFDAGDMVKMDLAWWSYPAMRRVDEFLSERPDARIFEYGAGASTLWLAKRAGQVDSVEHDAGWAESVREMLADTAGNAKLHVVPPTGATADTTVRSGRVGHTDLDFANYVSTIDEVGGSFDLIVVDGRARVDAFRRSLDHLEDDGVVVFDNIKRKRYWDVLSAMPGLRIELLKGGTPTLPYPTTTGLIWRD